MSTPITVVSIVENKTGAVSAMTAVPYGSLQTSQSPRAAKSERDKKEIERLRKQHPDYCEQVDHWKFLLTAYEGGPFYPSEATLFRHQRENEMDFKDRLSRATYANYTAPIVDFVPEFIFNQPIDRTAEKMESEFEEFKRNCDMSGTDLNTFMHDVAVDMRLFGQAFVQVDKPAIPDGVDVRTLSKLDVKNQKLDRPYLVKISPLEVLDWRIDTYGNYVYIKRVQNLVEERGNDVLDIERYYEWSRAKFKITEVDVTDPNLPVLIGSPTEKPNKWKTIPFVPFFNKRARSSASMGISSVQDIAYQNRSVFNKTSLIDEFLYRQCFNILVMEKDSALPQKGQVQGELGTSNVLEYPPSVKHEPKYLSPPADPAQFIQSERDHMIAEMYRQAAQDVASELFAVSNRSGDAAKQAFGRGVPVIAKAADILQQGEVAIMSLWALMQGKEWKGKVAYKDNYDITNVQDLLLQLTTAFNSLKVISPAFVKEEWKRVIRELDGRIPVETLEKIYKEIDAMSDDDVKAMFSSPDVKAAAGMPSTANMMQGNTQKALGTDKKRSMATGDRSANKEANPDVNKRAKGAKGSK